MYFVGFILIVLVIILVEMYISFSRKISKWEEEIKKTYEIEKKRMLKKNDLAKVEKINDFFRKVKDLEKKVERLEKKNYE